MILAQASTSVTPVMIIHTPSPFSVPRAVQRSGSVSSHLRWGLALKSSVGRAGGASMGRSLAGT